MIKNMNLQLFAEGDIDEGNADLNQDINTENIDTNVDDNGNQQPDIDVKPDEQSTNKDNPANHAFAEMRRKIKEQETQLKTLTQKQTDTDTYYANLARQKGRTDINTADEYFKAIRAENLAAEYQETQDPLKLAALIKEMIMPELKQPQQENVIDNGLDKEIEDFNKEYKGSLKSIADITTLPNYAEIVGYMQDNNLPLSKAYALANPDKIKAANKQAAINQVRGNTHIQANNNGGSVDTTIVTAGEVANWKRWFPGKTDEQCRKEISANKKLIE
jgi:hypothetical protein